MTIQSYDLKVTLGEGRIPLPKQPFFNLPQEKRRNIEQVALDEFAEYGFDSSNMNRIVDGSKIAKGSFYQYFDDKKDLYFHLIDTVITRKMAAMEPILNHYPKHSFSHNLKELFRLGLEFADSDPQLYRLGEDFTAKKPALVQEFLKKYAPVAQDIYGKPLAKMHHHRRIKQRRIRILVKP